MNGDREDMAGGVAEADIALTGFGLHLPGAATPDAFWAMLRDGRSAIRRLTREELVAAGEAPHRADRPDYVPVAADLDGYARFDAGFWGLSPKDAAVMDPQHRQFLEVAWEALEDAALVPERFDGRIGVYAGCGQGTYYRANVLTNPDLVEGTGQFLLRHTGNDKDFLATRVAFALNLHGPALSVQTACSTSLVAVHLAAQALHLGECDAAIAGGVTIELPQTRGYLVREGEILSPDGICHAFDHRAQGTVFGSGAGAVVLRRLSDAIRDGDPIWAVLKGSAINNDGARKAGYLAPSVDGQADAIAEAQALAGVHPDSVALIECHGTGTYLGDPIEIAALTDAFRRKTQRTGFARVGSVKTNIGHTDTAAGVASLAKAAMAVHHGLIPPSLGYEAPNPAIPFDETPFQVADRLLPFPDGIRRAAVNSLGVGGTNAHAIVEQPPGPPATDEPAFPFELIQISARTKTALDAGSKRLAAHLRAHPDLPLADVAHTLRHGRRAFAQRRVLVAGSVEQAATRLESADTRRVFTHEAVGEAPDIAFMFPGGGAQHPGMGRGLYETEPVFRDWMDRGLAHLESLGADDPRGVWLPGPGREAWATERMLTPSVQLPLLMIVEYALAQLWMSWGIEPSRLIGHSMGENTAAAVAGVMGFEACIGLVHHRGALFDTVPEGGMLSVPLPADELAPRLAAHGLDLAVENAPRLSVASGPAAAVAALAAEFNADGIEAQPVPIRIAAHSAMLDGILPAFRAHLAAMDLRPPRIPILSNRTGAPLTDAEATSPDYWTEHLRRSVRFSAGLAALAAERADRIYLEVGPGRTLASLAGQQPRIQPNQVVGSLRHRDDDVPDDEWFQAMLGRVWAAGGPLDAEQLQGGTRRRKVRLPTYPWEHAEYLIAPGAGAAAEEPAPPARTDDIAGWGWVPRWRPEAAGLLAEDALAALEPIDWLIVEDEKGLGAALATRLRAAGHRVVTARAGDATAPTGPDSWVLCAEEGRPSWDRLLGALATERRLPSRVVHLWLATEGQSHRGGSSFFHRTQEQGFWSLLHLAQAWSEVAPDRPLHLVAVTTGALQTRAEDVPHPEKATALGPVQVLPREMAGSTARLLDIEPAMPWPDRLEPLLEEVAAPPANAVAALRAGRRLVRDWAAVPLPDAGAPLKAGGPVLITGGFGGIGLTLAADLAREAGAPIVLIGRSPLPPREAWPAILRRENGPVAQRIRAVQSLEAGGARVLPLAADVTNLEEMRAARAEAEAAFGPVSGVIHAAGVVDDAPLVTKSDGGVEDVLAPKVMGTQVLTELWPDGTLDWLVLFSSSSTATAPAGQVDYVAANAYLSALARARAGGRTRVVALDWGVWHGVGMAAEAMADRRGRPEPPIAEPTGLPFATRMGFDADGRRVVEAPLSARGTWMLDEHRTRAGDAVLPGTGIVELAAEALVAQGEPMPWRIEGLTFLRPFAVADEAVARLTLARDAQGYALALSDAAGPTAEARIDLRPVARPAPLDLDAIERRLDDRPTGLTPAAGGTLASPQERHLAFGPRWRVLHDARLGDGEGLARLRLPPTGAEGTILHPGLLDLATGWAMALIPGYAPDALWVPLTYGGIVVHAALTPEIASHVRLAGTGDGSAWFDVTLAAPDGRVLVEATGFTIRRLDAGLAFAAPTRSAARETEAARPLSPAEDRLARAIQQGIRPDEGAEAFRRALVTGRAEVLVSPVPLDALLAEANRPTEGPTARGFDRPATAGEVVPPEGPAEEKLAALWTDLLGVSQLGAEDSFFDLGGHSLIAVRLFNQVKRAFGVELPISALFEAPTIRRLAALIADRGGALPDAAGAPAKPSLGVVPDRPRFTHVVPMHQGEGGPRLPFFLVSGMFGNVLNLRHLGHLVGTDRPVYGLQARGLIGGAAPHDDLVEAATSMIAEMRQVQRDGPWLVGGFSGGGITAYEIARQLAQSGEQVAGVVLIDTPLPRRRPLARRDRMEIQIQEMAKVGPAYPLVWLQRRRAWARDAQSRLAASTSDETPAFHDVEIERAFYRAIATYPMHSWDGPLTLFRPPMRGRWTLRRGQLVNDERNYVLPDNDWTEWAPRLQVIEVPGDHDSMVLEPNVRVLAARMRRVLDAAERGADRTGAASPRQEAAE